MYEKLKDKFEKRRKKRYKDKKECVISIEKDML